MRRHLCIEDQTFTLKHSFCAVAANNIMVKMNPLLSIFLFLNFCLIFCSCSSSLPGNEFSYNQGEITVSMDPFPIQINKYNQPIPLGIDNLNIQLTALHLTELYASFQIQNYYTSAVNVYISVYGPTTSEYNILVPPSPDGNKYSLNANNYTSIPTGYPITIVLYDLSNQVVLGTVSFEGSDTSILSFGQLVYFKIIKNPNPFNNYILSVAISVHEAFYSISFSNYDDPTQTFSTGIGVITNETNADNGYQTIIPYVQIIRDPKRRQRFSLSFELSWYQQGGSIVYPELPFHRAYITGIQRIEQYPDVDNSMINLSCQDKSQPLIQKLMYWTHMNLVANNNTNHLSIQIAQNYDLVDDDTTFFFTVYHYYPDLVNNTAMNEISCDIGISITYTDTAQLISYDPIAHSALFSCTPRFHLAATSYIKNFDVQINYYYDDEANHTFTPPGNQIFYQLPNPLLESSEIRLNYFTPKMYSASNFDFGYYIFNKSITMTNHELSQPLITNQTNYYPNGLAISTITIDLYWNQVASYPGVRLINNVNMDMVCSFTILDSGRVLFDKYTIYVHNKTTSLKGYYLRIYNLGVSVSLHLLCAEISSPKVLFDRTYTNFLEAQLLDITLNSIQPLQYTEVFKEAYYAIEFANDTGLQSWSSGFLEYIDGFGVTVPLVNLTRSSVDPLNFQLTYVTQWYQTPLSASNLMSLPFSIAFLKSIDRREILSDKLTQRKAEDHTLDSLFAFQNMYYWSKFFVRNGSNNLVSATYNSTITNNMNYIAVIENMPDSPCESCFFCQFYYKDSQKAADLSTPAFLAFHNSDSKQGFFQCKISNSEAAMSYMGPLDFALLYTYDPSQYYPPFTPANGEQTYILINQRTQQSNLRLFFSPTPITPSSDDSSDSSKNWYESTGAKVGLGIGGGVILIILIAIIRRYCRNKGRQALDDDLNVQYQPM